MQGLFEAVLEITDSSLEGDGERPQGPIRAPTDICWGSLCVGVTGQRDVCPVTADSAWPESSHGREGGQMWLVEFFRHTAGRALLTRLVMEVVR
jgi:hypothetical protein